MSFIQIALLGLRLIMKFMNWAERREYIKQGEMNAFARGMAQLQVNMKISRQVQDEVDMMTADEVDDALEEEFRD